MYMCVCVRACVWVGVGVGVCVYRCVRIFECLSSCTMKCEG